MNIVIASDHRGFVLKNLLSLKLRELGHTVYDTGPETYDENDDYPDFVKPAVQKMIELGPEDNNNRLILLCKNGVGVSITANRNPSIRCALTFSPLHAESSKIDDDTNAVALPVDFLTEETAMEIIKVWLSSQFSKSEKDKRRLDKINK